MDFNYSYSTFFENKIEENKITRDTFENQGDTQREELQHRTSGTTYVSSEIQRNIQSDDLEEEIQQCKISLDSIIQKGPIDTVIRSIVNFYAEKLRNNKVTYNIVEKCLTEYRKNANTYKPKEPELFIEISKSIGHKKYCKTYYKNNDDGKKCDWDKKANDNFKLIIGKYESYTNKLKSNRGNIKTGFWEYVCFILSKHGHNNYTPTQCAVKYKNCKAKKK